MPLPAVPLLVAFASTAACAYYDQFKGMMVPNWLLGATLLLAIIIGYLSGGILNIGVGVYALLFWRWTGLSIGPADGIMLAAIGFLLGWVPVLLVPVFAVMTFSAYNIARNQKMPLLQALKQKSPFIPHLLAGLGFTTAIMWPVVNAPLMMP